MAVEGDVPAETTTSAVLMALVRCGRWEDAADYAVHVDEVSPLWRVALLFAVDRVDAAHELLGGLSPDDESTAALMSFFQCVDSVAQGQTMRFGDLVSRSADVPLTPLVAEVLLHAARAAGQSEAAAHYGRLVLGSVPGDLAAIEAVAADLARDGDYVSMVNLLDSSEPYRPADGPDPLDVVLETLGDNRARALATIGHFRHREKDPTLPVDEATLAARKRWRAAYRANVHGRGARAAMRLAAIATAAGLSVLIGNALPVLGVALALMAWTRSRPLPGLDPRTTRIVRALDDPMLLLKQRRYRPIDVATFVVTAVVIGALAAKLPHRPTALVTVEVVSVAVLAAAATRGRRRWARRDRARLRPLPPDDRTCRCLDLQILRGPKSRSYGEGHLFQLGPAPAAPRWQVLQCMITYTRFLDIPAGEITIQLTPS